MKVIDTYGDTGLSEIGHGVEEVKFAYLDPKSMATITKFCKCKDFFQDMFWSKKGKKDGQIYGFSFNHKKHGEVLDGETLYVCLKIVNRNTKTIRNIEPKILSNLEKLFKEVNKGLKYTETKFKISDCKNYLVVSYDKRWSEIPYLNSGFLLFLRLGLTYEGDDVIKYFESGNMERFISPNDIGYFRSAKKKIEDIIKGKLDTSQTYESYGDNIGQMHNNSGIVNYTNYKVQ